MIQIVGDGSFYFNVPSSVYGASKQYKLPILSIVLDNGGWGMLAAFRPQANYTRLGDWDFAQLAEALGGVGHRVRPRAQLRDALERAAADRGRFQLIHVALPPGSVSPRVRDWPRA